jgi:hypothetical protein
MQRLLFLNITIQTMTIIKTTLPVTSLLNQTGRRYDYADSFQGIIPDKENKLQPAGICKAFFLSTPKWIKKLLGLRNVIVGMFGLKTSGNVDPKQMLENFKCDQGDRIGLFKVFEKTDNEVILGEDDKHLNFRISFFLDKFRENENEKQLTISTIVVFKNLFGRLYFLLIKPLHKFIVPAMLKSIIQSTVTTGTSNYH